MRVQVKKWGNSASIRIPAAMMAASKLQLDQFVELREEAGRISIEPVVGPTYTLDALLEDVRPETFHDEVDVGGPIGDEVW